MDRDKHILPENGFTAKTEELKNCQIMARVIFRAVSKMSYCKFSTALRTYIIALRAPSDAKVEQKSKNCDKLTSTSMIQAIIGKHTLPATVHSTRKLRIAKYHLTK